jgi:hypothetical protein
MSTYSYAQYVGTGATATYLVPFEYLNKSHITVTVDNVVYTAYTWLSSTQIGLDTAPANGVVVDIRRATPAETRLVDFVDGSILREADLDLSALQTLFISQEAIDFATSGIYLDSDGALNSGYRRIKNLANPVDPTDAVNKQYFESVYTPLLDAKVTAVAASATTATTQAGIATAQAAAAVVSATAANANSANVTTVAGIAGNVTTVAGSIAGVNTVSANTTNINTVAGINAAVTTVAGISAGVTTVANNAANVSAVVGNATNINAAVANATNINVVAANSANVTTVSTNITAVVSAQTNLAAIIDAPVQAANAATSASNAAGAVSSAIGVTVQAYDADLTTLGAGGATARTLLGLAIGANVQAYNVNSAVINTAQSFTAAQRGSVSALTDGATITPDFALANNYSVTLGGNRTLANPTNLTAGQSGVIKITQDGTGSRTLAYGSYWKFAGGTAPTLTTTANSVDVLAYYADSTTTITTRLIGDRK